MIDYHRSMSLRLRLEFDVQVRRHQDYSVTRRFDKQPSRHLSSDHRHPFSDFSSPAFFKVVFKICWFMEFGNTGFLFCHPFSDYCLLCFKSFIASTTGGNMVTSRTFSSSWPKLRVPVYFI
jgi:hypothetical protein